MFACYSAAPGVRLTPNFLDCLYVMAGVAAIKLVNNVILYSFFSRSSKGQLVGKSEKWFDLVKLVAFLILLTSLLVPAHLLFIVPTLQRSAFWDFCSQFYEGQRLQCCS